MSRIRPIQNLFQIEKFQPVGIFSHHNLSGLDLKVHQLFISLLTTLD